MSLETNLTNLATRIATECKAIRTLLNGNTTTLAALSTTNKANLVGAINEVHTLLSGFIDDASSLTTKTWSSQKIATELANGLAGLVNSAPAALDTLAELSTALANDPNFAATISTALGLRLRFDTWQSLDAAQQIQGRANLNVYSTSDIGDIEANYVYDFDNALL